MQRKAEVGPQNLAPERRFVGRVAGLLSTEAYSVEQYFYCIKLSAENVNIFVLFNNSIL